MNALREEFQQLRDELIALRREFHRAPELGLHEYHTAARIERELDRCGIPHERVGETAVLEGTTRMFSPESRAHLRETINAAAAHISALYGGGTAEVEWDDFATPLTNDAGVCGEVERVADALGIPTTANRALSLSGDDFAEYLLQTKGAYAYLGTANPKKPHTCISNHRGDFDIDEETLPLGAALYAAYALSVLDPQFAK